MNKIRVHLTPRCASTALAIASAAIIGVGCVAPPKPENAVFRSITLVDDHGQPWALLGTSPRNGLNGIYLLNKDQGVSVEIVVENGTAPHLLFKASDNSWRMSLSQEGDGAELAELKFFSPDLWGQSFGFVRAAIGVAVPSGGKGGERHPTGFLDVRDPAGSLLKAGEVPLWQ